MNMPTTIHFVRHGEVDNPTNTYYGRLPNFYLSPNGRDQAQAAANSLMRYPITAVCSSPMERAIETAGIIAGQLRLTYQVSDLLNEVHSPLDGETQSLVAALNWNVYEGNEFPFEQPTDVLKRAQKFTWAARQEHSGKHIVAVTHGDVIAFMVLWARQLAITNEQKQTLYQTSLTYASISSVTFATLSETETPRFVEGAN
jgi:broad specificity phosphatase PhoE